MINCRAQNIDKERTLSLENFLQPVERLTRRKGSVGERSSIGDGLISLACMAVEMSSIFLLGLLIAHFHVGLRLGETDYYPLYVTPLLLAPVLIGLILQRNGLYETAVLQRPKLAALDIMKWMGFAFILLIIVGFFSGIASHYSRVWFVSWAGGSIGLSMIMRAIFGRILHAVTSSKIPINRVAILGDQNSALQVWNAIDDNENGIEVVGAYSEDCQLGSKFGSLEELIELGQNTHLDRIIIAVESVDSQKITRLLDRLSILPTEVLLQPTFLGEISSLCDITPVNGSKLIRIQKKPISEWGLLAKSMADKIMAITGLAVLSPILIAAAIAIKLDSPGPVFFRQKRHGYNQKEINVWKFRSMTVMENGRDFKQVQKGDARITRIGSFLRKSSIDELPQLFNVLRGEMSIVGPRPHPVALNEDFAGKLARYSNRHKVKPGITGWAQVNGYRGPTDRPELMRKRVEFDLDYIENWSLWFDFKIILATPYYGLISKNAF